MRVIYLAHPVSGNVEENLRQAKLWYAAVQEANPGDAITVPWYATCAIYDNYAAVDYDLWLRRDCAVVERCDGIVLVGPIVSIGMRRESGHAKIIWDRTGLPIGCDLSWLVLEC